jgi:GT2 family glycosyltransferase
MLAIIVPTYNRAPSLKVLLNALYNQTYNEAYKVIVIVDGSTDSTIEMIHNEYPIVDIVLGDGSWWWTRSINEGLKYAILKNYDTFLLMNDDTFVDDNYLEILTKDYKSQDEKGILGTIGVDKKKPHYIVDAGVKCINWGKDKVDYYYDKKNKTIYDGNIKGMHKSCVLGGRGTIFNKKVIEKLGYLDEKNMPQYGADNDFVLLANEAGLPVNITWNCCVYINVETTVKINWRDYNAKTYCCSLFDFRSRNYLKMTNWLIKKHANGSYSLYFLRVLLKRFCIFIILLVKKGI